MAKPPLVMVVCGEESGDRLAAAVVAQLKQTYPGLQLIGVGGAALAAQGLRSEFPLAELSVMGLMEVLWRLPKLLTRKAQLVQLAQHDQPDLLLTVDAPDFSLRVARAAKAKRPNLPCVHMVSPSVWAWRPERVHTMAKFLDHVLALLPFEPPYYANTNLPCTYVGHPVVQAVGAARALQGLHTPPRLAVLPGSRQTELPRLAPLLARTAQLLQEKIPGLEVMVPLGSIFTPAQVQPFFTAVKNIAYVQGEGRLEALATCDAALAKCGTNNLELAVLGLPHVVTYQMHPWTYRWVKRQLQIAHVSPVNLVAGEAVVPELLQNAATPAALANALLPLLGPTPLRQAQQAGLAAVRQALQVVDYTPAQRAAQVIASYLPQ